MIEDRRKAGSYHCRTTWQVMGRPASRRKFPQCPNATARRKREPAWCETGPADRHDETPGRTEKPRGRKNLPYDGNMSSRISRTLLRGVERCGAAAERRRARRNTAGRWKERRAAREGSNSKTLAREALSDSLDAIRRTARAFAADAVPLTKAFVAHEMPATFLTELKAEIKTFEGRERPSRNFDVVVAELGTQVDTPSTPSASVATVRTFARHFPAPALPPRSRPRVVDVLGRWSLLLRASVSICRSSPDGGVRFHLPQPIVWG